MRISEAMKQLKHLKERYGDLPIEGGFIHDDTPPTKFTTIDERGCETDQIGEAVGVFIE